MKQYRARHGTTAEAAMKLLETVGEKGLSSRELALALEIPQKVLKSRLYAALAHGAIRARIEGQSYVYSLPTEAQMEEPVRVDEPDGFRVSHWLDGDVVLAGFQTLEDGSVLLSKGQVGKLIRFLRPAFIRK